MLRSWESPGRDPRSHLPLLGCRGGLVRALGRGGHADHTEHLKLTLEAVQVCLDIHRVWGRAESEGERPQGHAMEQGRLHSHR